MTLSRFAGLLGLALLASISAIETSASASNPGTPSAAPAEQARTDSSYQLRKAKEWWSVVAQHEPGKPDTAAVTIGAWPSYDLETVVQFLTKQTPQTGSGKRTPLKAPVRRTFDLTEQEVKQADLNRILRKGAILHTDVALLELDKGDYQHKPEGIEGIGIFVDGRVVFQPQTLHWQFARRLVDLIARSPSQEEIARKWYVATTAHMEKGRLLGYAGQNLKSALEKFPSDARLQFYAGALHENWAAPVNQNSLLPPGAKVSYGSAETELRAARQHYVKALEKNPGLTEARLRLGRATGLMGNHRQAEAELQKADASLRDPQLSYYASLYLGFEYTMLARRPEANARYERAAMLFPAAQSPLFALSQLALDGNDVDGALRALQRVFALPHNDPWNDDPWWVYGISHVRDAAALIGEMRTMFGEVTR
jgi:tetratricopeptide (TPR) repeat protein